MGESSVSPGSDSRKWWTLLCVAFGAFMAPLDSSIVHATLPLMARDLHADVFLIRWVVLAYLLTLSSFLLVGGRLGDRFGDRRLYVGGFALFTLSSLLCGLSTGVGFLIGARVLQAVGGTFLIAIGPAMLTRTFPSSQRGRALGIQASVVYLGLAIGPGLGGLIAAALGWRWVFFINLPIGITAVLMALAILPRGEVRGPRGSFDVIGACAFAVMLFPAVLAISQGAATGWNSSVVHWAGSASAAVVAFFLWWEFRQAHPFLDLRLFRHRLFSAATASALCNYMASSTTAFLTPFYLIRGNRMTPDHAGALLMAMPITMALVAPLSGWLSDQIGSRLPTVLGMSCVAMGMWLLGGLGIGPDNTAVAARLALIGLGIGLFTSPNNSAIMGAVPRDTQGLASGLVATARTLGNVLGVAVSGALFGAEIQRLLPIPQHDALAVVHAYGQTVRVICVVAVMGALASLVRGPRGAT